jgi:hypothetical protein
MRPPSNMDGGGIGLPKSEDILPNPAEEAGIATADKRNTLMTTAMREQPTRFTGTSLTLNF